MRRRECGRREGGTAGKSRLKQGVRGLLKLKRLNERRMLSRRLLMRGGSSWRCPRQGEERQKEGKETDDASRRRTMMKDATTMGPSVCSKVALAQRLRRGKSS
jgi:hypothetical protein